MVDGRAGPEIVERPAVAEPDQLLAAQALHEALVGIARDRDPLAVLAQAVLGVRLHRRGDVRGQRPRRRRPDDERLTLPVEKRKADEERGVGLLLVDARLAELVLGKRRAAPRAPLRRAVADIQPAALVDDLQEAPDVLDVRIAERVVVVAPVHPLAEALRAPRQLGGRLDDDLAAPAAEPPDT